MAIVIPAILTNTVESFTRQLKLLEPVAEWVQVDVCDGEFVPEKTFDPTELKNIPTSSQYDLHLMVARPGQMIEQLYDTPHIKRITFHVESVAFPTAEIEHSKAYGHEAWIAVKPETELAAWEEYAYEADGVLFVAVSPGKQGQGMRAEVLEKIKQFKTSHPTVRVGIDGGVKTEHIPALKAIGVEEIIMGSAIATAQDPAKELERLRALAG